jgi:hypothetical protein
MQNPPGGGLLELQVRGGFEIVTLVSSVSTRLPMSMRLSISSGHNSSSSGTHGCEVVYADSPLLSERHRGMEGWRYDVTSRHTE